MIRMHSGLLLWLVAFSLLASQSSSVLAAFTPIGDSPDRHDEPNLIGVNPFPNNPNPSVLETLYGEHNLLRIDDAGDVAFFHTGVEANVKAVARFSSIGYRLWLLPNRTGQQDFLFDVIRGATISGPQGYVLPTQGSGKIARANSGPVFGLKFDSYARSDPRLNNSGYDQLATFQIVGNAGHPNNVIGNLVLAWEASPLNDIDFQDMVYEISGVVPVPEPAGWILASSSLVCVIRRRPLARLRSEGL